jgi:hypothetical protein
MENEDKQKEQTIVGLQRLIEIYEGALARSNLELFELLGKQPAVREVVKVEPYEQYPGINRVIHRSFYTKGNEEIYPVPDWFELKAGDLFMPNILRVKLQDTEEVESAEKT